MIKVLKKYKKKSGVSDGGGWGVERGSGGWM